MKKIIFITLLSLLMPVIASAYDAEIDGIYYNFSGSEAEVTFKDAPHMPSYSGTVVIPKSVKYNGKTYTVTCIGGCAFSESSSLTTVTIPNSVGSIEESAFNGCTGLSSITIPNSVTSIGFSAFGGCSSLTSITIPESITEICDYSFSSCISLTSITIPNSVTSIGISAFNGCASLTSIIIPNSVTSIGDHAFEGCIGLTSINIPNSVTSIAWCTFSGCTGLTSVTISNGVINIDQAAFSGCTRLISINIPNSVTRIDYTAFSGCTGLTSVTINCSNVDTWFNGLPIKEVILGENVASIFSGAFSNCTGLTSVTINCSNVGSWFGGLPIKEVTLGEKVANIDTYAFYGCSSLTSVVAKMEKPVSIENYTFTNCSNATLYVQASSMTKYKNTNGWENFKEIVGIPKVDGIYYMPDNATKDAKVIPPFVGGKYEGDKIIPSTITSEGITYRVTSIDDKAFEGCTDLTSITIPESVTNIGNRVFSGCSGLDAIVVEQGNPNYDSRSDCNAIIETGSNRLIYGCNNTSIPNNVTSIGDYAFDTCSSLHSLTINVGVLSIGKDAFYDTFPKKVIWLTNTPPEGYQNVNGIENYVANDRYTDLKNATVYPFISSTFIVDGIKYVPVSPSERTCDAIDCVYNESAENINISDTVINRNILLNVKQVKPYLCYGNPFVKGINFSAQCGVASYAFSRCTTLKTVKLGEKVSSIGSEAFSDCSSLDSIAIPDSVTYLGSHAFENCPAMTYAKIGSSITLLPNSTFRGCSSLPTIQIPQNVTTINDYVFGGCTNLKTVLMDDGDTELTLSSNDNSPLFADCPLDSVYIGRNITYPATSDKGYSPFYRNTTLRSVTITDKETEISTNEFYGCTNLKNVKIGDGVTSIGDYAFSGCTSLEAFAFGSSVEAIGTEAFSDCIAMTTLVSKAETPPVCGSQALDDINKWECTLMVPDGFVEAYQVAPQWREFFFIDVDPDGIKEIESLTPALSKGEGDWYDLNGRKLAAPQKGVNIIRYSDGTTRKVLLK